MTRAPQIFRHFCNHVAPLLAVTMVLAIGIATAAATVISGFLVAATVAAAG